MIIVLLKISNKIMVTILAREPFISFEKNDKSLLKTYYLGRAFVRSVDAFSTN